MNIVYFTSATGLDDGDFRRQVLRIPEVVTRISRAQMENQDWDLILTLSIDELYSQIPKARRLYLVNLVQQGLFDRWLKKQIPYAKILRRQNYSRWSGILAEFKKLLCQGQRLKIFVIGPGVDELSFLLKDQNIQLIDSIDHDPVLHWFWPELKRELNG